MSKTYRARGESYANPDYAIDEDGHPRAPAGRDPATAEARELKRGNPPTGHHSHKPSKKLQLNPN